MLTVVESVMFGMRLVGVHLVKLEHGDADILGRNFVAVLEGDLHSEGCVWCEQLKKRCQSRRQA